MKYMPIRDGGIRGLFCKFQVFYLKSFIIQVSLSIHITSPAVSATCRAGMTSNVECEVALPLEGPSGSLGYHTCYYLPQVRHNGRLMGCL